MKGTAKHKYATIGFVYLFGLICASFLESKACFIVFAVLAVVFGLSLGRSDIFFRVNITLLGGAFLVFGLYKASYAEPCRKLAGGKGTVSAQVAEVRSPDNDIVLLTLSGTADGEAVKLALFTADKGISVGDRVEFEAVFSQFSDSAEFSESSYYFTKGIFLKAYAASEIAVAEGNAAVTEYASYASEYFKGRIDSLLSDGGGIIKAMFFGDKSGLSDKVKTDMTRSGISHLTAVSGMHLSMLVHLFAGALSFFFRKGGRIYFWVIAAYILVLMLFFGMTASVMRSGFMMIVCYGSELGHRKSAALSSVGAALLVILALNPCACRDAGLMLSAAGTLGVGIVAPKAAEALKIRKDSLLSGSLLSTICASLCTMPIGALCFGGISFAAPLTTLLVQPFFTVILILVPLALLLPFLSQPILFIAGCCGRIMEKISAVMGGSRFSYISVDGETVVLFLVLLISGAVLTAFISKSLKPIVVFAGLVTAAFAVSQALYGIIGYDYITINIFADSDDTILRVEDKTGVSFYMLSSGGESADVIYEQSVGIAPNFICVSSETENRGALLSLCDNLHFPETGNMEYNISGEYTAVCAEGEIILDIRGITVGILPAGSETECDISVYCGYKENYGCGGSSATILCDKKYYNCGEAVNAFLNKTEIVINSEGMYALSVI